MAVKSHKSRWRLHLKWRALATYALLVLGIISLIGFSTAHFVERQVLTTNNWVKMVGPLPGNPTVASALSSYSVDKLFTTTNLENNIGQVLPPRAAFLAPTLTGLLQSKLAQQAKNIIESDTFQGVWEAINRTASQRLIANLRGQSAPPKIKPKFNIDLDSLRNSINSLLGRQSTALSNNQSINVNVNLEATLRQLRDIVKAIDFFNGVLGLAAVACLLGAIVVAEARRKMVIIVSLSIAIVGLLELITLNVLRSNILNIIQNSSYRLAVGIIYDSVISALQHSALVLVIAGFLIFIIAFITRPSFIRRSKYLTKQLAHLKKTKLAAYVRQYRALVRQYFWQISLAALVLGLIMMALIHKLSYQSIVRSLLAVVIVVEIVSLIAVRRNKASGRG